MPRLRSPTQMDRSQALGWASSSDSQSGRLHRDSAVVAPLFTGTLVAEEVASMRHGIVKRYRRHGLISRHVGEVILGSLWTALPLVEIEPTATSHDGWDSGT